MFKNIFFFFFYHLHFEISNTILILLIKYYSQESFFDFLFLPKVVKIHWIIIKNNSGL